MHLEAADRPDEPSHKPKGHTDETIAPTHRDHFDAHASKSREEVDCD